MHFPQKAVQTTVLRNNAHSGWIKTPVVLTTAGFAHLIGQSPLSVAIAMPVSDVHARTSKLHAVTLITFVPKLVSQDLSKWGKACEIHRRACHQTVLSRHGDFLVYRQLCVSSLTHGACFSTRTLDKSCMSSFLWPIKLWYWKACFHTVLNHMIVSLGSRWDTAAGGEVFKSWATVDTSVNGK